MFCDKLINLRKRFRIVAIFLVAFSLLSLNFIAINLPKAISREKFDPGMIITDELFYKSQTMKVADIQNFMNSHIGSSDGKCHPENVSKKNQPNKAACLKDYKMNTTTIYQDTYCAKYTGVKNESSASIIYKVANICGINPQVLLVMLQKEQGLVTDYFPVNVQYKSAMGYGCSDTAPCDAKLSGFQNQVYRAARQFQLYRAGESYYTYRQKQNNNIKYNPKASCGTKKVYIQNQATAGLYIYTPYTPNDAALNANYGVGDSCSSYGNRNFFNYFNDWFGSPKAGMINVGEKISRFTDVQNDHLFVYDIAWIDKAKITTGVDGGNTFNPSGIVTRGAMAAFLYREAGSPKFTPTKVTFKDVPKTHLFYKEIEWLYSKKITTGVNGTKYFKPSGSVSRASMAAFIYRFCGNEEFTPTADDYKIFSDIKKESADFQKSIIWLDKTGITEGKGNGTYKPRDTVNRGSMSAFLHRIKNKFPDKTGDNIKNVS